MHIAAGHLPKPEQFLFLNRFLDPIFFGKYPLSMEQLVAERLPEISDATSKMLVGSLDFVGINHYTSLYTRNDRTRIRKLILQDASSDAAVITTRKPSMKIMTFSPLSSIFFFLVSFIVLLCSTQKRGCNWRKGMIKKLTKT